MAYRNLWAVLEQRKEVLLEFKAGKMTFTPTSKLVVADKRKGLIQLKQNPEDYLLRFIWKDRVTGTEELNLIIFPGEASFRKVEESKARVYVLEWKDLDDKKFFFWIQEIKEEKDKENCEKLNQLIDEPQTNNSSSLGMNQGQGLRELLQAGGFGGMDTSQLVHILGEGTPNSPLSPSHSRRTSTNQSLASTTTSSAAPALVSHGPVSARVLQNILDELLTTQIPNNNNNNEEKKEEDKRNEEDKETPSKDDNTQTKEDRPKESEEKPH